MTSGTVCVSLELYALSNIAGRMSVAYSPFAWREQPRTIDFSRRYPTSDDEHLIKPTLLRKQKWQMSARLCIRARTASSLHSMQFRGSSRNLKDPGSPPPRRSNMSETSFFHGCLQNATRHSFSFGYFISIFRVSSLFITLLALLARPLFFPSFFPPPFSCLSSLLQDFSGAPLARSVSCSSRGYDESSDLPSFVFVTLNIRLAWRIYYSSEIYSEKRIAPLEKCRLHAHKFDFK